MTALEEYRAALAEHQAAQTMFDNADPADTRAIDAAIQRLNDANARLDLAMRRLRRERAAG